MWVTDSDGGVRELAFAPDSRTLYAARESGRIEAWDLATRSRRVVTEPGAVGIDRLAVSPDGRNLRVISSQALTLLDAATGAVVLQTDRPDSTEAMHSRREAGTVCGFDVMVKGWWRWDWSGALAPPFPLPWPNDLGRANPWNAALHPDGRTLAVGEDGPTAVVFDLDAATELGRLTGLAKCPLPRNKRMAFAPAGDRLLVFGDGYLAAFEWPGGRWLWANSPGGRTEYVSELVFHPSGVVVAYTAGVPPRGWPSVAWFADVSTGAAVPIPHPGFRAAGTVAFAPDGLTCAIAGDDGRFAVFDVDL